MRTRIIAVAVAAVLAVVGAIALVVAVRATDQAAVAGAKVVSVLVVRSEVPAGTSAERLGDTVAVQRIPARFVATDAVADVDDLAGLVAAVDLQPGEQVLASRFSSPEQLASAGVHASVPAGLQEIAVAVDLQRIAGGTVGPGDRVGVFASYDNGAGASTTDLILDGVLVTSVTSTIDPATEEKQAQGLVLVTLALSAADAVTVVHAAEFGHIWMSAQNDDTLAAPDGSQGASK